MAASCVLADGDVRHKERRFQVSKWFGGVALMVGLLIGYAATNAPALAQGARFPLQSGETVELHLDPSGGGFPCVVIEVRGDFIGCKNARQEGAEDWYNIRGVGRIHRSSK